MSTLWKSSSKQSNQGFRTKEVSIQSADLWFEKVRKGEILEILSQTGPNPFSGSVEIEFQTAEARHAAWIGGGSLMNCMFRFLGNGTCLERLQTECNS